MQVSNKIIDALNLDLRIIFKKTKPVIFENWEILFTRLNRVITIERNYLKADFL